MVKVIVAEILTFQALFGHFSATTTDFRPKMVKIPKYFPGRFFNHVCLQLGQISGFQVISFSTSIHLREMLKTAI